jgi:preprotein translocase subunit SecD
MPQSVAAPRDGDPGAAAGVLDAIRLAAGVWLPFDEGTYGRFVFRVAEASGRLQARDRMLQSVRARFDRPGLSSVSVMRVSDDGVIVDWIGDRQVALAAMSELGKGPVLEFRLADTSANCLAPADALFVAMLEEKPATSVRREVNGDRIQIKSSYRNDLVVFLQRLEASSSVPAGRKWFIEENLLGGEPTFVAWCLAEAILTEADVAGAQVEADPYGLPYVGLEFTAEGRVRFSDATAANIDGFLAIVVDGKVVSVPMIRERIPGGRAHVTMGGSSFEAAAQAAQLASQLQRGGVGVPLVLEQELSPADGIAVLLLLARLPPFPEPTLVCVDLLVRILDEVAETLP